MSGFERHAPGSPKAPCPLNNPPEEDADNQIHRPNQRRLQTHNPHPQEPKRRHPRLLRAEKAPTPFTTPQPHTQQQKRSATTRREGGNTDSISRQFTRQSKNNARQVERATHGTASRRKAITHREMRVSHQELVGRGVVVGPQVVHLRPRCAPSLVRDLHRNIVLAHRHRHLEEEEEEEEMVMMMITMTDRTTTTTTTTLWCR